MKHSIFFIFLFCCISLSIYSQVPKTNIDKKVDLILSQMTLEEKIDYIGGYQTYNIQPMARFNLPLIKMFDGPVGPRNEGKTTSYPCPVLLSSSWNTDLAYTFGQSIGNDCRARGVHILLMPGVNIMRSPLCGRNFEYYSEDPYLASRIAVNTITGLQSKGVMGCVKHFALNNQEWDRCNVSSDADERTMQEIYLPAFKAAVTEAKVATIMDSYNLINGSHSTENAHLNIDILRKMWGFKGIVMSDWGATHNSVAAAKGGLDLEMGDPYYFTRNDLLVKVKEGAIPELLIDEKVRHILYSIFNFHFDDRSQQNKSIPLDDPKSCAMALKIAEQGIVLLKNDNKILPVNKSKVKSIIIVGPNADKMIWGGGSSSAIPFHFVTTYEGIKKEVGHDISIRKVDDTSTFDESLKFPSFYTSNSLNEVGLKAEYYNNQNLSGNPILTRIDRSINFDWENDSPDKSLPSDHFSVRWTGVMKVDNPGIYSFKVKGDDGFRMWIDDKLIIDEWNDQASKSCIKTINLNEKRDYNIRLEYYEDAGQASINLAYKDGRYVREAAQLASKVDMAIVCVGFDAETETEGSDRTFDLSGYQSDLIKAVASANSNTLVIVNAGGNINMQPWLHQVKGLLYAWYPGQEGGTALANIIFGRTNPSGKLPVSFEKKWEDNPAYSNYYDNTGKKAIEYREKLLLGYRYYDTKDVEPQFPFGFGLSYSTFLFEHLKVYKIGKDRIAGSIDVKNASKNDGYEVVQVYVHPINPSVSRPVHELKFFKKVFVKAGTTINVPFILKSDAFSYFNINFNKWMVDKCKYMVEIGKDSRTILEKALVSF